MRDRDTRPDHKEVPMSLFKNAEPKAPEIIKDPEETPVTEPWNEARGLELYRTMRAYRQNRQEDLLEDTKAFFTPWLQAGLPGKSIPNTLPMLALTFLYEETHDQAILPALRDWAEWLMSDAPRAEDSGALLDAEGRVNPRTIPLALLFLYRAGYALEKEAWRSEARYQLLLHAQLLWDAQTGLWHRDGGEVGAEESALIAGALADWKEWLLSTDPVRRLAQLIWEKTAPKA